MYTYTFAYIHVYVFKYIYIYIYTYVDIFISYIHTYTYIYIYLYILHLNTHIYSYIHIHGGPLVVQTLFFFNMPVAGDGRTHDFRTCGGCSFPNIPEPQKIQGGGFFCWIWARYCWWKKSCTIWDVSNPVNNGTFTISTGAGFLPSTVLSQFAAVLFLPPFFLRPSLQVGEAPLQVGALGENVELQGFPVKISIFCF